MALRIEVSVLPSSGRQKIFLDAQGRLKCHLKSQPEKGKANEYLENWKHENPIDRFIAKELQENSDEDYTRYFDRFMQENSNYRNIPFSVMEFIEKTEISFVQLVHYFGYHDSQYFHQEAMGREALQDWARQVLAASGRKNTRLEIPRAGNMMRLG